MRLLLIAEDDHDTRTALSGLLSELGYSVCDAADGPRALDKLRSLRPDLVLLDYGLPAPKDGEDFLRAKTAEAEIAGIPVIVLSGYELPNEIDGTVAVIRKPFNFDRLLVLIRRIVGPPHSPTANAPT
jgi:CheY-like chemotaxis protein